MRFRLAMLALAGAFSALAAEFTPLAAEERHRSVALISDIHLNPFDPVGLAETLVAESVEDWPEIYASIGNGQMSTWGSDTNQALFAVSLAAFQKAAEDADFVLVLGDLLAHRFEKIAAEGSDTSLTETELRELAVKTAIYVGDSLSGVVPDKAIIIALGNNDSDCGDYQITPEGGFLAGTRDMVRRLAGEERLQSDFDTTYGAGGYYSVRHPILPRTKILVINDVLWSERYRDTCGSGGDIAASDMLAWLEAQLAGQQEIGGRVWLVHHIPWGIDAYSTLRADGVHCGSKVVPFLREPFAAEFLSLLRKYAPVIQTSLASHTHMDDYRLLAGTTSQPLLAQKLIPAISPVFGQNPGFSIAQYDLEVGAIDDFSVHYLANLDSARPGTPGDWRVEYSYTDTYRFQRYSTESVEELIEEVGAGGKTASTYRRLYQVGHGMLSENDLPEYLCAMKELEPEGYTNCLCEGGQ